MILDVLLMPRGLWLLRQHQKSLPATPQRIIQDLKRYPRLGPYRLLGAMQVDAELIELITRVEAMKPRVGLEIGTASGGTLYCWSHLVSKLLISVDLPGGAFGGGYEFTRERLYKALEGNNPGLSIKFVRGCSAEPETLKQVAGILGEARLDFLFIDGDHALKGVTKDLFAYLPFVADGGLVALHDIDAHKSHPECEVNKLWDRIRSMWNGHDIIVNTNGAHLGIGWFIWRSEFTPSLNKLRADFEKS